MMQELQTAERLSTTFRFNTGSSRLNASAEADTIRLADYLDTTNMIGKEVVFVGFTDSVGKSELTNFCHKTVQNWGCRVFWTHVPSLRAMLIYVPRVLVKSLRSAATSQIGEERSTDVLTPVDAVVGRLETLFAVRDGKLDGHMTSTAYFAAENPAFGLIGDTVGAWSGCEEMQKFLNEGGGRKVMQETLDPYNLHFVGAVTPGLEAFVSRVPLDGIDDLRGLRMRAPEGMVTAVFKELGAKPENMGLEVVKERLGNGSLDIADYSVFSNNSASGLHDVAKHPVYPGFHSMPLIEVSLNKDVWNKISPEAQEILTASVTELAAVFADGIREKDAVAIAEASNDSSLTIHDWSLWKSGMQ